MMRYLQQWLGRKSRFESVFWAVLGWMVPFFVLGFVHVIKVAFSEPTYNSPPYFPIVQTLNQEFLVLKIYLENFFSLFNEKIYQFAFWHSLKISFISTFFTLLLAYPMAYAMALKPKKTQTVYLALIVMPFFTSFLLRIYAWINLLSPAGIINKALISLGLLTQPLNLLYTDSAVILGMVYCYLPFMLLPLYTTLENFDWSLLEAATDLGAKPWRSFVSVILPNTLTGIFAGCFFVFIPMTGEYLIPTLLGGNESMMIGRVIFNEFFSNSDWTMASMLAIALLVIFIIPMLYIQKRVSQ